MPAIEDIAAGTQKIYSRTLDLFARLYDRCHDSEVRDGYVRTGITIRNAADKAFVRKEYSKAGELYFILAKSRVTREDFGKDLAFDGDYHKRRIEVCSKTLTQTGLMRYREEKLDEAIGIWRSVLSFEPDNNAVVKAIETATRQQHMLKSMQ